ncbi:hypothetical protein MPER_04233, partial [Moniliophthora perniciosa FA553]
AFRTSFLVPGHRKPYIPRVADYASMVEQREAALEALDGTQSGDPQRGVEVIIDIVRAKVWLKICRSKRVFSLEAIVTPLQRVDVRMLSRGWKSGKEVVIQHGIFPKDG